MQIPEELYERLAAAIERSLLASDSVQDAMSEINAFGVDVRLDVWAKASPTLLDILADEEGQLDLFADQTHSQGQIGLDWLPTEEDTDLLRSMGICGGSEDG
jgi:hypothetical protein